MSEPSGPADRVYTLTELEADTYAVIERIRRDGPALVTRNGRFVALITPVTDAEIMSKVLSQGLLFEELRRRAAEAEAAEAEGVTVAGSELLAMVRNGELI